MKDNRLRNAAMAYARQGWHVFPLTPNGKAPLTAHGVKDATDDVVEVATWWTDNPDANIGVACGVGRNAPHVVDVDAPSETHRHDGAASLKASGIDLPPTLTATTPSGGRHYFYLLDETPPDGALKNGANVNGLGGVDVRTRGGYVVVSPSVIDGRRYAWTNAPQPLATFPRALYAQPKAKPQATTKQATTTRTSPSQLERARAYLARMDAAISGRGGHNATIRAASALVVGFNLADDDALALLLAEYNPRCVPPWSERELRHKVESARTNPVAPFGHLLDAPRAETPTDTGNADTLIADALARRERTDATSATTPETGGGLLTKLGIVFEDAADFVRRPIPPPEWIVSDFIARRMKGDLCASSKTFKTYFSLQLAQSVAAGRDFLGGCLHVDRPHRVAYLNLELFDWNFQERMQAQERGLGIESATLRGNLLVANLRGNASNLRGNDDACLTCDKAEKCRGRMEAACRARRERDVVDALAAQLIARGVEFVILDPRYKLIKAGEDENTGDGLRGVLALRDALAEHFAVMVVTHDPKGDTTEKKTTDRGAGSYTAGADYDFRLTIDPAEGFDVKDNPVYVIEASQRARPPIAKIGVRFDAEKQTFFADADVSTDKATRKTISQAENAERRAGREAEVQRRYREAALEYVAHPEVFPSVEQFDQHLASVRGASVAINQRPKMRAALVSAGVLATTPERDRNSSSGLKRQGRTFISTPERIARYLRTFGIDPTTDTRTQGVKGANIDPTEPTESLTK